MGLCRRGGYLRPNWDSNTDGDSAPFPKFGGAVPGSVVTPTLDGLGKGVMTDPDYDYARRESPFLPMVTRSLALSSR